MNKEELIKEYDEKAKALRDEFISKLEDDKKEFELTYPKDRENLFYISNVGANINFTIFSDDEGDRTIFEHGLYFKTYEEAEQHLKERKLIFKIKKWAEIYNEGWVLDWEERTTKYFINILQEDRSVSVKRTIGFDVLPKLPFFKSHEIAQACIDEFGDEIKEMNIKNVQEVGNLLHHIHGIQDFIDVYDHNKFIAIENGSFSITIKKEQEHEIINALEKIKDNMIEELNELCIEGYEHIKADINTASITKKKEYPKIIDLPGKHDYDSQIWISKESESTKDKLQYYGYDANLYPLPDLSKTSKENQNRVLGNMGNKFKDINMEIWLDDIKLKNIKEV